MKILIWQGIFSWTWCFGEDYSLIFGVISLMLELKISIWYLELNQLYDVLRKPRIRVVSDLMFGVVHDLLKIFIWRYKFNVHNIWFCLQSLIFIQRYWFEDNNSRFMISDSTLNLWSLIHLVFFCDLLSLVHPPTIYY